MFNAVRILEREIKDDRTRIWKEKKEGLEALGT